MNTRRGQSMAAGLLVGAVLLGGTLARAQNFTTSGGSTSSGSSGGSSTTGSVTLNNQPNFDPAAAAAAALVGNYRVPGAAPVNQPPTVPPLTREWRSSDHQHHYWSHHATGTAVGRLLAGAAGGGASPGPGPA